MIDDLFTTKERYREFERLGSWYRVQEIGKGYLDLEPEGQQVAIRKSRPGDGWFLVGDDASDIVLRQYALDGFEVQWRACTPGAARQAKVGRVGDLANQIAALTAERDRLQAELSAPDPK